MKLSARKAYALAIGVLLAAAAVRLWQNAAIPRGLWLDEGFFLLEGQKITQGQGFPIYFTDNHGIEPLFPYLCSLAELMLGHVSWAGRLITAWLGVLGVACVMRLGQDLFPGGKVWLGAGLITAFFYWDINFSRFSNLPQLTTFFTVATLAAFWYGVRTGRRWPYLLAGLAMGLGLNAYAASRFIPFAWACGWLATFVSQPRQRRALLVGGLITAGIALLVYSPLLWFFIQNPKWFFLRYNETTSTTLGAAGPLAQLWSSGLKTLGGLFWAGDTNWRHNLAGRPALDASQILFFMLGLWALGRAWRRSQTWLLLGWLAVGLSLSVVTEEAPHFGRTTLAIPAITLIMGLGLSGLWQAARRPLTRNLLLAAVALSAALSLTDYFGRWATSEALNVAFATDQQQLALALRAAPPADDTYATPLYINLWDTYWSLEYLVGQQALPHLHEFNGNLCTLLPAFTTQAAHYAVMEPDDVTTPQLLRAAFTGVTQQPAGTLALGNTLNLYHVPAGQAAQLHPAEPVTATFGDLAQLRGYDLQAGFQAGGQIRLTTYWEVLNATTAPYKVFVHVVGQPQPDGNVIYAQQDAEPCTNRYSTLRWRPGEIVVDHYTLTLPNDLPAGAYTLEIGWYNEESGRLTVTQASSQSAGDTLMLKHLQLAPP